VGGEPVQAEELAHARPIVAQEHARELPEGGPDPTCSAWRMHASGAWCIYP
jgi:hypothetical protein